MRASIRLAVLCSLTAASAGAQNARVVQRSPDPRTDSLVDRIYKGNVDEVKRIVAEWRERDGRIFATLRATPVDGDVTVRRRIDEDAMRSSREAFAMMRAVQERCEIERGPVPEGYIGVSLDTEFEVVDERPPRPVGVIISSVEPDGPSQRAGLQSNDRLIAIGGRDARQRIPEIGDLLVPGRILAMKVERNGATREVSITVAPRPKGFAESCGEFEQFLMPLRAGAFGGGARERVAPGGGGSRMTRVETGPLIAKRRTETPNEILFFFNSNGPSEVYFAGAKFRSLDDDWRDLLGVKQGVLVFEVATGSLAARAGLRSGDVVTAVEEEAATDPMVFGKLLEGKLLDGGGRREATLAVTREKRPRSVTLTWGPP
jgi:S1-C subfamily serine protease